MGTEIIVGVREANNKWKPDLIGYIHVYENDKFLYEERSKIKRTNKRDAVEDAQKMKADILEQNGGRVEK